ncbi:MAG: hypothetical protein QF645_11590, partial [Planctomycetota bacterium]|nr:hypothetical protein [Planctomycetota bacterium]
MKFSFLAVFLLPVVLVGCSSCSSSSNLPATTFNLPPGPLTTEGMVMTDIGGADDSAKSIQVQNDGKIVVAGTTFNGTDKDIALLRYLENGQLDTSFGEGGIVSIDIANTDDHASHLFVQEDGNLVISGYTFNGIDNDFALLRFTQNGDPEEQLQYTITIENLGDNDDSYDMSVTNSTIPNGYTAFIIPT